MILTSSLLILASIFTLSLIASVLARKFSKPNVVLYILFGLIFGNLVLKTAEAKNFVEPLANLGIVLLLFTIGLELPLDRLKRAGKLIVSGAFLQIVITGVIMSLFLFLLVKNIWLAVFIGIALSMSSTAVVGKLLQNQAEDTGPTGEISLGILIIQDLVSVLLITIISFFGVSHGPLSLSLIGLLFAKVIVIIISLGFLNLLLKSFEKFKLNREELTLFIFALLFLLIGLYSRFDIPAATAGFMIGMLLAGKREHYEIFSQVRVFRDVLLVLFFFFLATYIHTLSLSTVGLSLILAILFMVVKFVIIWLVFVVLGLHQKTAFWVGFDLMQIGEFAFVLLTGLSVAKLIDISTYQLLLMVITWTLMLFSLIYKSKIKYYRLYTHYFFNRFSFLKNLSTRSKKMVFDQLNYSDHIVLCGYGRVGSYIGHGLMLSNLPLVVVDINADNINKLLKKGVRAVYGDATEADILDYAQVDKAKFLIISVPNWQDQEEIINVAQRLNPKIQILTRSHLNRQIRHFKSLGVMQIVQPEFEAALTILKRILKNYKLEKPEIKTRLQYLKMEHGSNN